MERTACYRYRQIARYLRDTGRPGVRLAVDVGANVGDVTVEILTAFPSATVHAFEVVPELVARLRSRFFGVGSVHVHGIAVSAITEPVYVWEALSSTRAGWRGGSIVAAADAQLDPGVYRRLPEPVPAISLPELVKKLGQIDFLKTDCEGSEIALFDRAELDTLRKIRWIGGEYHGLARWWPVHQRLTQTHRVNLVAEAKHARRLGSFFAERADEDPGLLEASPIPPRIYPWGIDEPLSWHARKGAWA